MKKRNFISKMLIGSALAAGYYYFCPSIQSVEMSDLTMANIEALANKLKFPTPNKEGGK